MYRIIELKEYELPQYEGKIIQVISSEQHYVHPENYLDKPGHREWTLTCLVEEKGKWTNRK